MDKVVNKVKEIDFKYFFFIIILYLGAFIGSFDEVISILKYFDELLATLFIPIAVIDILKNKKNSTLLKKENIIILILLTIVILSGLTSNIIYKYQDLKTIILDMITIIKFYFVYLLSSLIFNADFFNKNKFKISIHIKGILTIFLIATIFNYIFELFPYEERFGILTNTLVFRHPTYLAASCIFLYALLTICTEKSISFFSVISLFIVITTLRYKAIGCVVAIILMTAYVQIFKKKLSLFKLGIIALILITLVFKQISFYFLEHPEYARNRLIVTSVEIAKDYFPLGTGFATFGSNVSKNPYSPVYKIYELDEIYGLSESLPMFICDAFWGMLLGQFGILGFVPYIIIILLLIKIIQKDYEINKYAYLAKMSCLIYLLIASTSESSFVNPIAIPLAIIIGSNFSKTIKKEVK